MILGLVLLLTLTSATDIGRSVITSSDCRGCLDIDVANRMICFYHQEMYCCDKNSTNTFAQCNGECFDHYIYDAKYLVCPQGLSCGYNYLDFGKQSNY